MDLEEDIIEEENEKEIIIQNEPDFNHDDSLLKTLKTTHKAPKGMYFDEDYFTDLVINKYLPTIKRDENGKIISSDKVLENEDFLAFHDIAPKAPIHVLIIPKKFTKDFQQLSPKEMVGMTEFIQECAKTLGLDKNGYRIISNVGIDGGQEIPYLHFHLLGGAKLRWDNLAQNISEQQRLEEAKKGM